MIRVPDSKSMPKFRPFAPRPIAPIARITPDMVKNHRDAPMKSNVHSRCLFPAPSALGLARIRERPIVPRIAWVKSTAVRNETRVPMPSVSANPRTPAVASTKRMNATMMVTTFASMIAVRPLR